jgi:hypothetical protein
MKTCNVYFDENLIYIVASATTSHGFNVATQPMVRLPRAVSHADLGERVYEVLTKSGGIVPTPKDLAQLNKTLLEFLGYRSWRTFEREAKCVLVELTEQGVRATPTVTGSEGGFLYRPELAMRASDDAEDIGRVILQALTASGNSSSDGA